ncbi:MAG: flagellar hook-basal body complex protein FliE [Spirochaetaceae bacterium]|nr:MAG: flagellar hook-basal body complex protein FliE [Spirochaetaceae bacterium]
MNLWGPETTHSDVFRLVRTDPRHMPGKFEQPTDSAVRDFSGMLLDSLQEVSRLENKHQELSVRSIIDPDSVNPHDVTIASAKASLALNITKNVVDGVVRAYRDIVNVR